MRLNGKRVARSSTGTTILRAHAEVIAAFDGAIAALGGSYAVNVADHHLEGVQSQRLHRAART
jgi:hypothetical protein